MRRLSASLLTFFALMAVVRAGPEAIVTFNELQYHPLASQSSGEWIELRNQQMVDVDLSGWRLDDGIDFVFAQGTVIKGGKYLVVAANPGAFQAATGVTAVGPFRNLLADGGETVTLKNKNGRVMDSITYNDRFPWPVAADGSGATLAKINELGATSEPRNWRASLSTGGTPADYNFIAPAGTSATATSQAGVRRYFPFEGDARDASGNNFNGALLNGAVFSNETPPGLGGGQSLDCDGTDDYAQVIDAVQPLAYTIAAWVKPDAIRAQSILVRTNASGPNGFFSHNLRMDAEGKFQHVTSDGTGKTVAGTTIAQPGEWTHVVIVAANGGNMRLYVNGAEQGAPQTIGTLSKSGDRWMMGSGAAGLSNFDGRIDEVAIWHTAFDAAAVQALYAGTIKPGDPAPTNVALQKSVIDGNGAYAQNAFNVPNGPGQDFTAQHVTDGSDSDVFGSNYWLGREATVPQYFTVDLGAPQAIKQLLLRNTHNTQYNDRGTLNFRIFASSSVDGAKQLVTPVQILSGTLGRVDNQAPIVAQAYTVENGLGATTARYLKFEALTAVTNNAGLNELEVYTAFSGTPGVVTNTHPTEVPLVFNEVTGAGATPFWIELHNYGAALPIGGYVIASELGGQFTIPGQTLASGGFVTFDASALGFTPATNEKLFLYTPGRTEVIDGVIVKAAHQGRRMGLLPGEFLETLNPAEQTPGAVNNITLPSAIVINEIMYHAHPRFRDGATQYAVNNEQWVELHNRSAAEADVSGWRLDNAVQYSFPAGTRIAAGGFVVVANDTAAFAASHTGVTALGPFNGNLSNGGEAIVLQDALGNVIDEVPYRDNKPWPEFADGGGCSLELLDPNADNSVPEAWAASDETARSQWQNYTFTMTAQTPVFTPNIYSFYELRVGLLDAGEMLLDDVSVIEDPAGLNRELMQNGGFDTGTTAWRLLGTHELSNVVSDGGGNVLKVVATGAFNYHPNLLETSLKFGSTLVPVVNGRSYKISFRAKWLRGSPQLRCELYYNKLAKTVILAQPTTAGTPGAANSTRVPNLGPTFKEVRHNPVIPAASQPISVSASVADPQGVNAVTVRYLVNGGVQQSVAMSLDATGRWTGIIPGQTANAVVQFFLEGVDGAATPATSSWPRAGANSRALIQVADNRGAASRQNIRVTMTAVDANALYVSADMMNNRHRGCTIVHNESEVFYDSEVRLHGSMFTRNSAANGALNLYLPHDHPFRGLYDKIRVRISGRNEIVIKHLINAAGGLPENFDDLSFLVGPILPQGAVGGMARLEMTEIDADYFDDAASDGTRGSSFKLEGIREYQTTVNGNPEGRKSPWPQIGWVFAFDIANQGTNPEIYRNGFKLTSNRGEDDYAKIVQMCQAFSQAAGPSLDNAVSAAIDADEWMRCFALESLCGVGDGYGFPSGNPHNLNFYTPPGSGKVVAVPWDWNFVFTNGTTTAMLPSTHNIAKVAARPVFARLFWGHVRDLCNTVFSSTYMAPWLSHYGTMAGDSYAAYASYIDARRQYALSRLPASVPFKITTNGGNPISANGATTTISGDGWIDVRTIHIDGSPEGLPVTWIDGDSWQVTIPVSPGEHTVTLTAFDSQGLLVGTGSIVVTGTGNIVPASAANLVVSEIMYHPAGSDAEFVEIMNIGAQTIDLTSCAFGGGIDYRFENGATLAPGARLVIMEGQFLNGTHLANGGERITLTGAGGVIIQDFIYANDPPWPTSTDGFGRSLVLVAPQTNPNPADPLNWRPSVAPGGNPGTSDAVPAPVNPAGDDNGNGWSNLIEYAVVMPELAASADAAGHLTCTFTRNLAADDAVCMLQTSSDLVTWTTDPSLVERVNQADPIGGTAVETWRTVHPVTNGAQHFIRLRVQLRP